MRHRQKQHSQRRDQKPVERDLLELINVGGIVEVRDEADCFFGDFDDCRGFNGGLRDLGGCVEDGPVDEDFHQVGAKIQQRFEAASTSGPFFI